MHNVQEGMGPEMSKTVDQKILNSFAKETFHQLRAPSEPEKWRDLFPEEKDYYRKIVSTVIGSVATDVLAFGLDYEQVVAADLLAIAKAYDG
jgi:hypothetical protein